MVMAHQLNSLASVSPKHGEAAWSIPSKAAAEQRAKELKCSGAFAMGKEWNALQELKGMFMTKQEAEQRAAELKCKGPFAMGSQWMACANEQVLHKALQNE